LRKKKGRENRERKIEKGRGKVEREQLRKEEKECIEKGKYEFTALEEILQVRLKEKLREERERD